MPASDPDWSLHMGHTEGNSSRTKRLRLSEQSETCRKKQRWTPKAGPSCESTPPSRESDAACGGPSLCRDATSLLQSVLQPQSSINKQPGDKTQETNLSFTDFFRASIEASLEFSSRSSRFSRALLAGQPSSSGDCRAEHDFRLPPLKEKNQLREESSSCLNCVSLQRRIVELQEKLSHLPGEQENTEASAVSSRTPLQPDEEELQTSEVAVDREEENTDWMEPFSPPQCSGDQDVDSAARSTLTGAAAARDNASKPKKAYRFQNSWLETFWFLRYSPTLDKMWCHVCRLHADKSYQNMSFIKGSRRFHIQNLKKHSQSSYHNDNVERHMWYVCDLKL